MASVSVLIGDIRFVKLTLLTVKGGTLSAKKLILKCSTSEKNKCIDDYLKEKKDTLNSLLKTKIMFKAQMNILFPEPTNLECWDISLLSCILLNVFDDKLDEYEKAAINALRNTRNELTAHAASTVMSEVQFSKAYKRLIAVFSQLTRRLPPFEQDKINDTVDNILEIQDFSMAKQQLQSCEGSDELVKNLFNEVSKSLEQRLSDCLTQIDELKADNVEMKQQLGIMAKIIVTALTPAERDKALAKLLNALQKCLPCEPNQTDDQDQNAEQDQAGDDEVLTASKNIVSDMKDNGVDIAKVEKGSILITFRCSTISSLKNISKYFADRMYRDRLTELENALSKYVGSPVKLNINIVLETLRSALEQIEEDANNKSIMLTLQCRGSEGVKNAVDFFGNGSSTNSLNNLSEALSRYVGQRVELHTTIDVDKLENDIAEQNSVHELPKHLERIELSTTELLPDESVPTESSPRSKHIEVPMAAWTKPSSSYSPPTSPHTSIKGHQGPINRQQSFAVRDNLLTGLAFDTETCEEHGNSPAVTERLVRVRSWLEGNNLSSECEVTGCITDVAYKVGTGQLKNGIVFVPSSGRYFKKDTDVLELSFVAEVAKQMKEKLNMKRILIFQLNAAYGISTQIATYDDKAILYISIHDKIPWGLYQEHGDSHECGSQNVEGFNINIPLDMLAGDADYVAAFRNIVMPIGREFNPEIVFVSKGFDAPISPKWFGQVTCELMSLANGKVVLITEVGHGVLSECKSADICLKCLLGKVITPIKEDQFQKLPSVDALQALERTIQIQLEYWPCLRSHLSTISSLQSETREKENIRQQPFAVGHTTGMETSLKLATTELFPDETAQTKSSPRSKHIEVPMVAWTKPSTSSSSHTSPQLSKDSHQATLYRQQPFAVGHTTGFAFTTESCGKHTVYDVRFLAKCVESWSKHTYLCLYCERVKGRRATLKEIESYHPEVDRLSGATSKLRHLIELPCGCFEDDPTGDYIGLADLWAVGCVIDLAYLVGTGKLKNGFVIFPVLEPARCDSELQLNFAAIAAKQIKEKLNMKKFLIFEWNASNRMSTQRATYDDKAILYISIHDKNPLVPYQEQGESHACGSQNAEGFNINITMDVFAGVAQYLAAFRNIVMPIAREFNPEIVLFNAGFDEPMLDSSPECFGHMTRELMSLANGKVVLIAEVWYLFLSECNTLEMCLKPLLGKEITPLKEGRLQERPSTKALQDLERTIQMQLKYWPCLQEHLSEIQNLLADDLQGGKGISALHIVEDKISDAFNWECGPVPLLFGSKPEPSMVSSTDKRTTHDASDKYDPIDKGLNRLKMKHEETSPVKTTTKSEIL